MAQEAKSLIVTLTDKGLGHIQQVADQLSEKGLQVNRVLPITGVISGTTSANNLAAFKGIDGVMDVEVEAVAYLPPSDAKVQ